MYNNKFFMTEAEAKAFRKEHGGRLLHLTPRCRRDTKLDFYAEVAIAYDARGEHVDPTITPWCVAWNELQEVKE